MSAAVTLAGVSKDYGGRRVLDGVTIEIAAGEIYGLMGGNGSGKTTLLRAAAGAVRPTAGRIRLAGTPGYVAQRFSLYEDLTVEENLLFAGRCYALEGAVLASAVQRVVDLFELGERLGRKTGLLSHGWKQRVALAAALCHRPRVLILDEATSGIDHGARDRIWEILAACAAEGVAVLLATHDGEEAERCGRLGYLREGRLIASGPVAETRAWMRSERAG